MKDKFRKRTRKKKSVNGSILRKMEEPAKDFALKNEVCQLLSLQPGNPQQAGQTVSTPL